MEGMEQKKKVSWMSWISRIFIILTPASVNKTNTEVTFSFWSKKSLFFCLTYFGLLSVAVYLQNMTMISQFKFSTSITDIFTMASTGAAGFGMALLPFFFASGIPLVSKLALDPDLSWPRYGLLGVTASLLVMAGTLLSSKTFEKKVFFESASKVHGKCITIKIST